MGFFDFLKPLAGAVPGVGPILQGGLGLLQGLQQNRAAGAQADAYNDWLAARQSGLNDLVGKLGERGIDPFGMQTSYGTNYGTTQSDSTTSFNNLMRKLVDPSQRAGKKALEDQVFGRLGTAAVSPSEQIRAVKAVNDTFENAMQGARDMAGIRGLGPVAGFGASQGVNAQRASQIANYLGQVVPELTRKRQFENEGAAQGLLRDWQGQRQTGTSRTTGTTMSQGGSSQTAPPDLTALANLFLPPSPQATGQTGQNPFLNAGADILGSVLQWNQNKQRPQVPGMTPPYNPNTGFTTGAPIAQGTYWGNP